MTSHVFMIFYVDTREEKVTSIKFHSVKIGRTIS